MDPRGRILVLRITNMFFSCVCVQREQPGGMWSGAVFCTGHGDPWEGFFSRAKRGWREWASHRGKQGGVHQVKERNGHQEELKKNGRFGRDRKTYLHCSILQLVDNLEVHPRRERADQSLPGWLQWSGTTGVAALLWWEGAGGEEGGSGGGLQRRPPRSFCRNRTVMTSNLRNAFSLPETISQWFHFMAI